MFHGSALQCYLALAEPKVADAIIEAHGLCITLANGSKRVILSINIWEHVKNADSVSPL